MAKAFALSESDQKILQQVIDAEKRVVRNTQQRPAVNIEDYYQSPDVYIAYTSAGGIPALNDQNTTGTGTSELDDIAGSAECDLYRLTEIGATHEITPIGYSKKVYNLSTTSIDGYSWVPIIRDKFGIWLASIFPVETVEPIGSTITVESTSGTPSYSSIDVLQVTTGTIAGLQSTLLTLTQPSAGTARLSIDISYLVSSYGSPTGTYPGILANGISLTFIEETDINAIQLSTEGYNGGHGWPNIRLRASPGLLSGTNFVEGQTIGFNNITFTSGLLTNVGSGGISLTIGVTPIVGGFGILYNNAGTLASYTLTTLGTAAGGITVSYP